MAQEKIARARVDALRLTPATRALLVEAHGGGYVLAVNATTEPEREASAKLLERDRIFRCIGSATVAGVHRLVYELTEDGVEAGAVVGAS